MIPKESQDFFDIDKNDVTEMHFPVLEYPKKVSSLNLDKNPQFSIKLFGIKGKYLIFEDGTVFNVRTFEGYVVRVGL